MIRLLRPTGEHCTSICEHLLATGSCFQLANVAFPLHHQPHHNLCFFPLVAMEDSRGLARLFDRIDELNTSLHNTRLQTILPASIPSEHHSAAVRYAAGTGALAPNSRVASEDFVCRRSTHAQGNLHFSGT